MYKRKLAAASFVRKSKLIIGLDLVADMSGTVAERTSEKNRLEREAISIVEATAEFAVAFKINRQLALPLGLFDGIPRVLDRIHDLGLTAIMDCKINDIGNTNEHIARYYYEAGFDAVIANPFVGWEGGLDSVMKVAQDMQRGVITLCYMSHPASHEGYGLYASDNPKGKDAEAIYVTFAKRARKWDVDGVIVGATYPEKIKEVKRYLGDDIPIISPGVGAQGASAKDALDAGASYVIVARAIVTAEDPAAAARRALDEMK
ncbi:MAG: orotidine 5'-phosphate decarboxylase [Candidatus Thorarchaeota archaeon]